MTPAPPSSSSAAGASCEDLTPAVVAGLRAGSPEAGQLLDRLYRPVMLRFCAGYLGDMADAEDTVQDIFCQVLKSAVVPDRFRPWIYKIARNQCLAVIRRRQRRRADKDPLPDDSLPIDQTGNLTRLVKAEARHRLADLLAKLTDEQRELLRLRYTENLGRREIADVLELPEPLVKSRLFEAIDKLRRMADAPREKSH